VEEALRIGRLATKPIGAALARVKPVLEWSAQVLVDFAVPDTCHWCGGRTGPADDGDGATRLPAPVSYLAGEAAVSLLGAISVVNHPFCHACLSRLEPAGRARAIGRHGVCVGAGWVETTDGKLFVHRPGKAAGGAPGAVAPPSRVEPSSLDVCAPFRMNDASLDVARLIKFSGRRSLVPLSAAAIAYSLRTATAVEGISALVPVPMHTSALRRRGFNQARLLADAVSRSTGIPVAADALLKSARTPRQSQTAHARRADNVRGAFRWVGDSLAGRHVCLVDDLVTSGATAAACASVLTAAGAGKVTVACLAKAL
jgi:ComF family protein